jgi:hypothetical protein
MNPYEVICSVRLLLTDESNWTRFAGAKDAEGRITSTLSPTAVRWCIMGAVFKICGEDSKLVSPTIELLKKRSPKLTALNDYQGHAAVLKLLDDVIADNTENPVK